MDIITDIKTTNLQGQNESALVKIKYKNKPPRKCEFISSDQIEDLYNDDMASNHKVILSTKGKIITHEAPTPSMIESIINKLNSDETLDENTVLDVFADDFPNIEPRQIDNSFLTEHELKIVRCLIDDWDDLDIINRILNLIYANQWNAENIGNLSSLVNSLTIITERYMPCNMAGDYLDDEKTKTYQDIIKELIIPLTPE